MNTKQLKMLENRTHKVTLIALLVLPFIMQSCDKDSPCQDDEPSKYSTYTLSETTKAQFPYNLAGPDTIKFKNSNGDEAILYGEPMVRFWIRDAIERNDNPQCGNPDYHDFEYNSYQYKGDNPELNNIKINIHTGWSSESQKGLGVLNLYSFDILNSLVNGVDYRTLNDEKEYNSTVTIDGASIKGFAIPFNQDTLLIFNKYEGILKLKTTKGTWYKIR